MAGQMVHLEIPTGDTAKAREFWGGLFGWEFQAYEGSPSEYHMTRFSETTGGAIMASDGSTKGPRVYFDTDDINASVEKVKELGGETDGAQPVPGMGWFAACTDSVGNQFGLWQNDPNAGQS
jgi:uncharacterized protein